MLSDRTIKHKRIIELMDKHKVETIVLRKSPNTAWFSGGRVHVPNSLDSSCFDIVISRDAYYFHSNAIEAPRLAAEELLATDDVRSHPWWIARDSLLPTGPNVGCDSPGGDRKVIAELDQLRFSLLESEVAKLDQIASDASMALYSIVEKVNPTQSETQVAGLVTKALWEQDLEAVFLGVAGVDRVRKFRHPLPTTMIIGDQVSISICARRKGLIASETRIISFTSITPQRNEEYQRLLNVEAAFLAKTITDEPLSNAFKAGATEYVNQGFASNEWHHHHQGGTTGFLPREVIANADTHQPLRLNQAVAWNPTAAGLKAESTWIATPNGPRLMGSVARWPQLEIAGRIRPNLLELT